MENITHGMERLLRFMGRQPRPDELITPNPNPPSLAMIEAYAASTETLRPPSIQNDDFNRAEEPNQTDEVDSINTVETIPSNASSNESDLSEVSGAASVYDLFDEREL
jgi:hypothetical protein